MRGYRARSACKRGDGKRGGVARRIADGEDRVGRCGGYHSHPHDLRRSRGAACDGVSKILTVQGQKQLSRLGDTDLKQYLIRANRTEIEG